MHITPKELGRCRILFDYYPRGHLRILLGGIFIDIILLSFIWGPWIVYGCILATISPILFIKKEMSLYKSKISDFIKIVELTGVVPEFKGKVEEEVKERPPADVLYRRLVDAYNRVYGRGKQLIDHKIESYIRKGLSREEAITKIAEEEGII